MKHRIVSLVLMSVLSLACSISLWPGCATTSDPADTSAVHYYDAERVYANIVRTMTALGNAGSLTLAQAERFELARASANRLLDEWRAAVQRREPWDGWRSLESVLAELVRIQTEASTRERG